MTFQEPLRPSGCSGKNCKWSGHWNVSAGGLGFGKAWSNFSFTGIDDCGCVYLIKGKGKGILAGVAVGYLTLSYNVDNYAATCEWPISKSSEVAGGGFGLGGAYGVGKVSISVSPGHAGEFYAGWGNWNAVSGVNAFVGAFALSTTVTEGSLAYSITK
jgi:hypothetical protein